MELWISSVPAIALNIILWNVIQETEREYHDTELELFYFTSSYSYILKRSSLYSRDYLNSELFLLELFRHYE